MRTPARVPLAAAAARAMAVPLALGHGVPARAADMVADPAVTDALEAGGSTRVLVVYGVVDAEASVDGRSTRPARTSPFATSRCPSWAP